MAVKRDNSSAAQFVVCINSSGYAVSLERRKIYRVLPDTDAEKDGDLRIVDESGEDYLHPADRFVKINLPQSVRSAILRMAQSS